MVNDSHITSSNPSRTGRTGKITAGNFWGLKPFLHGVAGAVGIHTVIEIAKKHFVGEAQDAAIMAVKAQAVKWGGFDRSDEQMFLRLNGAIADNFDDIKGAIKSQTVKYADWREAGDRILEQLLLLDDRTGLPKAKMDRPEEWKANGKWQERLRLTILWKFEGMVSTTTSVPVTREPVMVRDKQGMHPATDQSGQPLFKETFEVVRKSAEFTKDDPRVLEWARMMDMAAAEGSLDIPNTIEHLMANYLQDNPLLRRIGEVRYKLVKWLEEKGFNVPWSRLKAWLWLPSEVMQDILDDPGLTTWEEKNAALDAAVKAFRRDTRTRVKAIREEGFGTTLLRFWPIITTLMLLLIIGSCVKMS
jgi:hypothetical protein